jgi:aspartyl/asparaginyl-tRNA synthetase
MLDDIFDMFSQRSGLSSNLARMALPLVTRFLLRNAAPQRASGFMSMLPSSITNMFSNDERQRFTTTQENVSEDEVIDQISRECCNGDREKGRIAYQEALKVLREKTVRQKQQQQQQEQEQEQGEEQEQEQGEEKGKGGFFDNIFDSLKGRDGGSLF